MWRGNKGHSDATEHRQMQPVNVTVDDVEICGFSCHGFEQCCLRSERVRSRPSQPKRARPSRDEICTRLRVPAGKQCYLMPSSTSSSINHATTRSVPP